MIEVNLPEEWCFAPLSSAISPDGLISDGDWVESKDQDENGNVRLIQLADIGDGDFRNKSQRFMNYENAMRMNCTFLKKNDVLIARMPDPLGRACIYPGVGQEAVTVVDVCLIRTTKAAGLSPKLVMYWINTPDIRNEIEMESSGTTRKRITRKKLEAMEFPIPPLAEQQQIVQKLDELLAQVDSLKTRLDTIPKILKRFRQSVLAAAVSGRLTEEWREINSVNFDSWEPTNLGAVGNVATGKTPKRDQKEYWDNGTIAWLTSSATGNAFTYEAEQFVTEFAVKDSGLKLFKAGTLLLAMYGEGKTRGQVTELKISAACNQACAAITVIESKILRKFVKLVLQENYEETRKVAVGGAQPNLNLNKVREIPVFVPPLEEQTEIVHRVEQLLAYADQIEQHVKDAQKRVNHLTQSILAKAFRGELTAEWRAQNPDLISGENSAAALLERIKAEREATAKPKKKLKA